MDDMNLFLAHAAEDMRRYDDMMQYCIKSVNNNNEISVELQKTYSTSIKKQINHLRNTLDFIDLVIGHQRSKNAVAKTQALQDYRDKLLNDLLAICKNSIAFVERKFVPKLLTLEGILFCKSLIADLYRYYCPYVDEDTKWEASNEANTKYEEAVNIVKSLHKVIDPEYLSLMLNYTVFLANILDQKVLAISSSQAAVKEFTSLKNRSFEISRESHKLAKMMNDNITIWSKAATT